MNYNLKYTSAIYNKMLRSALSTKRLIDKTLSYREYPNAAILPFINWNQSIGCVIDKNHKLIGEPNNNQWSENPDLYELSNIPKIHKIAIYLGFMNSCFGHWFTDNLRKLWFLSSPEYKALIKCENFVLVYTIDGNNALSENQMFFYDILGCDMRNAIVVNEPMEFDKVIIPDDDFCCFSDKGFQFTKEAITNWNKIIQYISNHKPIKDNYPSKIYLTRTSFHSGKDYGEEAIENVFKKLGYEIISPEKLSLLEQLRRIRHCDYLAATEGSISHIALFCKPNTSITIISKVRWVNTHQLCTNEFADLNVTYIEAHHSTRVNRKQPWHGPFYMCITPHLEQYAGSKISHVPYYLDPHYYIYKRIIWVRAYQWFIRHIKRLLKDSI